MIQPPKTPDDFINELSAKIGDANQQSDVLVPAIKNFKQALLDAKINQKNRQPRLKKPRSIG